MNIQDIIAAPIDHAANGAERYSVHQLRSAFDLGALQGFSRHSMPLHCEKPGFYTVHVSKDRIWVDGPDGGQDKLRSALDSCLVAAALNEECGHLPTAMVIRAVVSYIEGVMK